LEGSVSRKREEGIGAVGVELRVAGVIIYSVDCDCQLGEILK